MRKIFIRSALWTAVLITLKQIGGVFFSWHLLQFAELPLVILIFMIALGLDFRFIALTALLTGLSMDIWSGSYFGIFGLALLITIGASFIIFQRMLTNKNINALLTLGGASTAIYHILIFFITMPQFLDQPSLLPRALLDTILRGGIQILAHSALLCLFFIVSRSFSKRLNPHYVHT